MRLVEFQGDASRAPAAAAKAITSLIPCKRLGGSRRVYEVGSDRLAVVFAFNSSIGGFALSWPRDASDLGVDRIYVWSELNIYSDPEAELDIPTTGNFSDMVTDIVAWIRKPVIGKIEVEGTLDEDQELDEMASRTTAQNFMDLARAEFGDQAARLTMPQMMDLARKHDVQIPGDIRTNTALKVDSHHWNLLGKDGAEQATNTGLGKALGADVEGPDANVPPEFHDQLQLAKVKTLNKIASTGKLYLMGRKSNGAFFRMPGVEMVMAQLERMLSRELQDAGAGGGRQSMEEQYESLIDKVKLVAGGQSTFIKSLLITGAPSSGKTFVVMKAIRELGLASGKDYIVKKGGITTVAMYRTLIEQIDGMVLFDDCDSVVDDDKAVNMLKGALDTDPIREISYDKKGAYNTAVMDPEHRKDVVRKMSRILRGKPVEGDLEYFENRLNAKDDAFDDIEIPDEEEETDDGAPGKYYYSQNQLHATQQWIENHLPNKIDFEGRIIFISNMLEDEWDGAIISRAFSENMEFTSGEMLDYIDKIKAHIPATNLTEDQKQEVMDYLRQLYTTGKLKRQINFRLVQQCFDLRLTLNWKKMMSML